MINLDSLKSKDYIKLQQAIGKDNVFINLWVLGRKELHFHLFKRDATKHLVNFQLMIMHTHHKCAK